MSNETKQTAVEKFIEKLEEIGDLRECTSLGLIQLNIDKNEYLALKEQAKEMEMNQIINDYTQGQYDGNNIKETDAYEYYNLIYGGNK
jgi:hypothetical protein